MAKRNRIGLTFSYDEAWIAGTYYILNLIHALKLLPYSEMPDVIIISEDKKNYDFVFKETDYPRLYFYEHPVRTVYYSVWERFVNKIGLRIFKRKIIKKTPKILTVDFVYPFHIEDDRIVSKKRVNWVPDFQELHLPQLFSKNLLDQRKKYQTDVILKGDWVVFSSRDSQKDFNDIYPESKVRQFILPFAVSHPDFNHENLNKLLKKYSLSNRFYFAPNQFWAHKNHIVILKALKELNDSGYSLCVAFSGKEHDHRNEDYVKQLKHYINENDLSNYVRFLGFIPRSEQLKLMKESVAVLQPSKFEGWSTVVEDAKALGQFLILSNIRVHREQVKVGAVFFEPDDEKELARLMHHHWNVQNEYQKLDYAKEQIGFARNFLNLIDRITEK